jgi:hypothetical protein
MNQRIKEIVVNGGKIRTQVSNPLTDKDRKTRDKLVKNYNLAKRKDTKRARYVELMEFENRMVLENKNG